MSRESARRRAAPGLVALWTRNHDATDSVVHFLETKAIAGLPRVSKALRSEQQRVLFAAARRAGALVSCTNAFLDALQRSGREHTAERETCPRFWPCNVLQEDDAEQFNATKTVETGPCLS